MSNNAIPTRRELRKLHSRSAGVPFTCKKDGQPWPCATVTLLRKGFTAEWIAQANAT